MTRLRQSSETNTVSLLLFKIFGGNPYYAVAKYVNGDLYYNPIEVELTEENIQDHVNGTTTLGSYQLIQGSNVVKWFGWDVDSVDIKEARDIVEKITKRLGDIPHAVEFSGRKGYHILIFLNEPMLAGDAKTIAQRVRDAEGFKATGETHVECFPKQDILSRDRPKGNLLKIPLGIHPVSREWSKFISPSDGWEKGEALDPKKILENKATLEQVFSLVSQSLNIESQLVDLISEHWSEGKRHDLSLYLCGFLANEGWGFDQTRNFMQALVERTKDAEEFNRLQTVQTTFERLKEGKSIRGRQGLGEILPSAVMQQLTELVSLAKAPDTVNQIDDIRYNKGKTKIEQARLAGNTIWSMLNDEGSRIFQTEYADVYWYSQEEHSVIDDSGELWNSMTNKRFGLNPLDAFSKMVDAEVRLRSVREAPIVPIYRGSYWSEVEGKLYVNFGGPEVYIITSPKDIKTSYNGECGIMFITNPLNRHIVPDFEVANVDCWEYLANDLSFTTSADAPASPAEQRELLKAWILSYFFLELLPTKPILTIVGAPGSGKTTAIRRILRILEDPFADVLGVPTDKQDAFRASVESHKLVVIDNLEKSGAYWMVDTLNKLATGNQIEIRELYKTNARHVIIPRCFIACTAVNMPFSDETLFSRLLVLEMSRLLEPLPEHVLQRQIREHGPAIAADLLRKLGEVVVVLRSMRKVRPPTKSRLVDFTVFCEKIKVCPPHVIKGVLLSSGLLSMVDAQMRQLKESSQAIYLLEEWISLKPEEAAEWKTITQIHDVLSTMAQARKLSFAWKSSQALLRHFMALEDRLKMDFAAEIVTEVSQQTRREVVKFRFKNTLLR